MSDPYRDRRRQRYAEDPEYRKRERAAGAAWREANREKINSKLRLRYAADPRYRKRCRKGNRARQLKCKYGITVEDYNRMFKKQKGRCAICKEKSRARLHVDHDHFRKVVRRLLCGNCNRGLGNFKDNSRLLRLAGAYIDEMVREYERSKRSCRRPNKGRAKSPRGRGKPIGRAEKRGGPPKRKL